MRLSDWLTLAIEAVETKDAARFDFSSLLPALFGLLGAVVGALASYFATRQQLQHQNRLAEAALIEQRRRDSLEPARQLAALYSGLADEINEAQIGYTSHDYPGIVAKLWSDDLGTQLRDLSYSIIDPRIRKELADIHYLQRQYHFAKRFTGTYQLTAPTDLAVYGRDLVHSYLRGDAQLPERAVVMTWARTKSLENE